MASADAEAAAEAAAGAPTERLATRTLNAARWKFAGSVVQGVLQFGVGVLLARLLHPSDFGVVALALVVIGLAGMLADLGLGPAIVRHAPLTARHVRVAFTVSVALGTAIALLLLGIAPLVTRAVRTPALVDVLRVLAPVFVLGGLGSAARALLQRALDFRRLFVVDAISYGVGYAGVAVTLALSGLGVWSLVAGTLVQAALASGLALAMVRHSVRPLLARAEWRDIAGFGMGVSANQIVNYAARNGDNLVAGRWLGAAPLGLYSRAYNLMTLPQTYVAAVASSVLYPAFAEARADPDKLGRAYLLAVQITALATAPVMAGMIVAAPHLVTGLYGAEWAGAALPLQVLCAAGLFRAVYHLAGALTQATGRVYAELRRQVGYALLVVVGSLIGLRWGLLGIATAVSGAVVYMYVVMAQLSLGILQRSWRDFLDAQRAGVLVAAVVAVATLGTRIVAERMDASSGWTLLALVVAGAISLPLGVFLLPARARPVELFARFSPMVSRLPLGVRPLVRRTLHLPTPETLP